jgi:hypothetical protein
VAQQRVRVRGAKRWTTKRVREGGSARCRAKQSVLSYVGLAVVVVGAGWPSMGCQGGSSRSGAGQQSVRAGLTLGSGRAAVSQDQAKADAFAQQARTFAELAGLERAQSASVATAIASERTRVAAAVATSPAKADPAESATTVAATSAVTTSGSVIAGGAPPTGAAVPVAAEKLESHCQKVAALADRLGANAQRLASFHLARVDELSSAAGEGGAQ